MLQNISESIFEMHYNDMIHGDLKPANFLLANDKKMSLLMISELLNLVNKNLH